VCDCFTGILASAPQIVRPYEPGRHIFTPPEGIFGLTISTVPGRAVFFADSHLWTDRIVLSRAAEINIFNLPLPFRSITSDFVKTWSGFGATERGVAFGEEPNLMKTKKAIQFCSVRQNNVAKHENWSHSHAVPFRST
jgi:hypothetical protein